MNAVHGWTRLSLWSVLHFVATLGARAFQQFWAAIPIAFATLSAGVAWLLPLLAGGFVILVLVALLQYRAFTYRLHGEGIEVRSGVVHKHQVNLQAQRVQNVRITQPVYFRPLGLVSLHIDSAGSSTDEVCLAALDAEQAQELQRWMMAESKHTVHADAVEVGEEITRAAADLAVYGATSNRVWVLAGAFAGIAVQLAERSGEGFEALTAEWWGRWEALMGLPLTAAAVAVAVLVLSIVVFSAAGAVIVYWDYRLRVAGEDIRVSYGLFTRRALRMQKARVQAVVFRQNGLARLVGRVNVHLEQIVHAAARDADAGERGPIIVPALTPAPVVQLGQQVLAGIPDVYAARYTPVSVRYFVRLAFMLGFLYLAAFAVLHHTHLAADYLWAIVPALAVHMLLAFARYRRWGVAVDGGFVIVRRGLIGYTHVVLPAAGIQAMTMRQSPFAERAGLVGSIDLHYASRTERVPFLPLRFAQRLGDYLLAECERGMCGNGGTAQVLASPASK